jgi:nucleotide-binding universal stress UspA family protein
MKTILIPTLFQQDTEDAVKAALNYAKTSDCKIILMSVSDIEDTYSASSLLRSLDNNWTFDQEKILYNCRDIIDLHANCSLKVHSQFGVSAPKIKNLLDHYNINMIVISQTFKQSSDKIHEYCYQILCNNKYPILHVSNILNDFHFVNAMYLESENSNYELADVQKAIKEKFSLKIVSRAKISFDETDKQILPLVTAAIAKNDIDVIIETRKSAKSTTKKRASLLPNNNLGIPVLSIYEEAYF